MSATDTEPAFPSVCPGYTTQLPEVIEAARAHNYFTKGELTQFCEGQATEALKYAIEIFESANNAIDNWRSSNPEKKS